MKRNLLGLLSSLKAKSEEKAAATIADKAIKEEYKNKEKDKPLSTSERLDRIERLLKIQ
jgi:hypothetical protein